MNSWSSSYLRSSILFSKLSFYQKLSVHIELLYFMHVCFRGYVVHFSLTINYGLEIHAVSFGTHVAAAGKIIMEECIYIYALYHAWTKCALIHSLSLIQLQNGARNSAITSKLNLLVLWLECNHYYDIFLTSKCSQLCSHHIPLHYWRSM